MNVKEVQDWLMDYAREQGFSYEQLASMIQIEHRGEMINLLPPGVEVLWSQTWTFEQCLMVATAFDLKLDIRID